MGKVYRINKQLSLKDSPDAYTLILGEKAHISIKKKDRLSLKTTIVSLINGGLAKQTELAEAFDISRQSISKYLKSYSEAGIAGLADQRPSSHGINKEIEKRVLELLSTSAKKTEILKIIVQEFGKQISRTKLYELRKKHLSEIQEIQSKESGEKKK